MPKSKDAASFTREMLHLSYQRRCVFGNLFLHTEKIVRVRKRKKSLVVANHGFAVTNEALCRNPSSGIRISPTLLHQTGLTP